MRIRVGGVPEHFNHPWHLAIENGSLANIGIELEWHDMHGGTGELNQMLHDDELDLAVGLTEGIVADILNGNPSLIVQKYIKSPLIWGIHAGADSSLNYLDGLTDIRFAISRYCSGSHIMASVLAKEYDVKLSPEQFVVTENFEGAVKALNNGNSDVLLWEKFTTLPHVKSGRLKRIGGTVTPWPCFVIAASQKILLKNPNMVWNMLWLLRKLCRQFMHDDNAEGIISSKYNLTPEEAHMWFNQTEWEQDIYISRKMLNNVMSTLEDIGLVNNKVSAEELCWDRTMVY